MNGLISVYERKKKVIIRNIFQKILDRIKRPKVIGTEYDDSPFERCVMCGKLTTVRKDTHIDFRGNYEIGSGQVCYECHKRLTGEKPICSNKEIKRLIDQLRKK